VPYTRDLDWEFDRRWRQPDARAQVRVDENDVSLEVKDVDGIWWMSLDGGPEVEIRAAGAGRSTGGPPEGVRPAIATGSAGS
jgi:hypothetical protein